MADTVLDTRTGTRITSCLNCGKDIHLTLVGTGWFHPGIGSRCSEGSIHYAFPDPKAVTYVEGEFSDV